MNGLELQYDEWAIIINVFIRLITVFIFLRYLIPLFVKEAQVKNGLKGLRYELLFTGLIIFFVNTTGIFIIVLRYLGVNIVLATNVVTYFNTIGFLVYALIKLRIYTQRYTPENKLLHEKIEKFEKSEMKKQARSTKNKR